MKSNQSYGDASSVSTTNRSADELRLQAQVIRAETGRDAALLKRDAAALAELLAEHLRYTHSNGRVESKADVMAGLHNGLLAYQRLIASDLVAHLIAPDVAV